MRTAAFPKRRGKNGDAGDPERENDSECAEVGVGRDGRGPVPREEVDMLSTFRRGPLIEDTERASGLTSEGRPLSGGVATVPFGGAETGDGNSGGLVTSSACTSPSVHCKCKMIDLVAHYDAVSRLVRFKC